jgi:hypothetical protein
MTRRSEHSCGQSVHTISNRLKCDRFFDWPPDPTVSKATPMIEMPKPPQPELSVEEIIARTEARMMASMNRKPGDPRAELRRKIAEENRQAASGFSGI